jgi:Fur family peroxide stress response transcriptional regulator
VPVSKDKVRDHSSWFLEECARAGLKATRQRRRIYEALAETGEHPDAETVYEQVKRRVPSVSLDTIYRNLRALEERGIIRKVGAAGYRTRYDANIAPHHHFVCTTCGRIRDFHDDRFDGYAPAAAVKQFGEVALVHVELRGTCDKCRAREKRRK